MKYLSTLRQSTFVAIESRISCRVAWLIEPQLLERLASSAAFFTASLRRSLAISFVVLSTSPQPEWSSNVSQSPSPPSPSPSPSSFSSAFCLRSSRYCSADKPTGKSSKCLPPGIRAFSGSLPIRWLLIERSVATFQILVIPSAGRRPVTCSKTRW